MSPQSNPTTQALRSCFWRVGLSILAYFISLAVIGYLVPVYAPAKSWRIVAALLPLTPIIFAFVAFIRFVRVTDELKRMIIVNSLAIAGGVNIFFTVTCGLLAIAGFPNPSASCAFGVFIGSWLIASVLLHRHYYYRCQ